MHEPRLRRARRALVVLVTACLVGVVVHLVWPVGPTGQLSYLGATTGGSIVAWIGVFRSARHRLAWGLLATGVTLSAIADGIYAVLSWSQPGPDLSVADSFWLLSYVVLFGGLLRLLFSSTSDERWEIDSLLDLGAMTTVALLAMWQYTGGDIVSDSTTSALTRTVWAAYPMLDAALLALVARSLLNRRMRSIAGPWLVAGVGCWLFSDLGTIVAAEAEGWARWLDLGWMLGALSIGAATWDRTGRLRTTSSTAQPTKSWDHSRWALGLLPLVVPPGINVWMTRNGTPPDPIPLLAVTVALVALAFARGAVLLQRNRRVNDMLASRQRYFSALATNSSDAALVIDIHGRIANQDDKISAAFAHGEPLAGRAISDFYRMVPGLETAAGLFDPVGTPHGHVSELDIELETNDGSAMWVRARAVNLIDDPDVNGIVVNFLDVTARHHAEAALGHQMLHDPLTGLANRALFRDRVEHALQRTARTGLDIAVVSVDLDGFRTINDTLGHDVGDTILRDVGRRLVDAVRSGDTLARLGADEFGILLEQSPNARIEAPALAERIQQLLGTATTLDGSLGVSGAPGLTASIGITISTPSATAAALQREADLAMNEARKLGHARAVVFEAAMAYELEERAALERDLATALAADEFRLVYQPVVELDSGRITGFEALIRWYHPSRGMVGPDVFIPLAEDSGIIVEIGRWVLRTACVAGARWQQLLPAEPALTMAVNVSGVQLASTTLVEDVAAALDQSGLAPSSLVVELTETTLVRDPARGATRLEDLRALGARIAIDDFGTGYSSLSYLRQFPIDILKIDRSFVQTIVDPGRLPPLVSGLLGLAKALDLETVAEGVEEETQRSCLADAGCDLAQGYLFARPLAVDDVDRLLGVATSSDPARRLAGS